MKGISLCYVFVLQLFFAVITGLTDGPGVCKENDGNLKCCGEYELKDDSCIWITKLLPGPGVCTDKRGNLRCCTNFQRKRISCTPCEVGTYGVNCTGGPCPYGSYGFGCLSKCNCTTDQYCDRRTGCIHNTTNDSDISGVEDRSNVDTVVAVAMAVIFSVGSFLVVIVFFYNERLKFLSQYLTRLRTNQAENDNTRRESEESQEDYSEMTRASNNYNMLSFNRRFNVVSRVNAMDDEDVYDQGGAVIPSQTEESL